MSHSSRIQYLRDRTTDLDTIAALDSLDILACQLSDPDGLFIDRDTWNENSTDLETFYRDMALDVGESLHTMLDHVLVVLERHANGR